jgi:hypothetical protein
MDIDKKYCFSFLIDKVGVCNVNDFQNVISELRYYYVGINDNKERVQKFYVMSFDLSKLDVETFIPMEQVTPDIIYNWLESSIHPDNLIAMKNSIDEIFNPPIKYFSLDQLTLPSIQQ